MKILNRLPSFAWIIAAALGVWVLFYIIRNFRFKKTTKILIAIIGSCLIVGGLYLYYRYRRRVLMGF
ncbi:MAG: hypothetical protein II161_06265 [Erysipelotrichaceae bacterium]|nr:hypothetical protein [Erysipelotrichaceae bacterium]